MDRALSRRVQKRNALIFMVFCKSLKIEKIGSVGLQIIR